MSLPLMLPKVTHLGAGSLAKLPEELKLMQKQKGFVVCDPSLVQVGLNVELESQLEEFGISYRLFTETEIEPGTDTVEKAAEEARRGGFDFVVGMGGGSSLDIAKGVSILLTNGGTLKDYKGINLVSNPGLPTVLIPTTAGSGSEATMNAIYNFVDDGEKAAVVSRHLMAAVVIIDSTLTQSCPAGVTASSGMDALVHAIETYTSQNASIHSDMYSFHAIEQISSYLRRAVFKGRDPVAREKMALGSFFAGVAITNAGTGAVHALAYPLGNRYHISHGIANSVMLPYVLKYNIPANLEKFMEIARLFGLKTERLQPWETAELLVEAVVCLSRDIGIPQRLRDLNIKDINLDQLAQDAVKQKRLLQNNPRTLTTSEILQIYQDAY